MARPFLETLRELRAGRTLEDLGAELATLVAAVKATGKPAELTLKIKIKPPKKGPISYLTLEDQIVTKEPKLDRGDTVFYSTVDNGLTRNDPSQAELPLRPVEILDKDTGEITQHRSAN